MQSINAKDFINLLPLSYQRREIVRAQRSIEIANKHLFEIWFKLGMPEKYHPITKEQST